ncbi:unnamed protein product, partial [Ascophyllum nodosum]
GRFLGGRDRHAAAAARGAIGSGADRAVDGIGRAHQSRDSAGAWAERALGGEARVQHAGQDRDFQQDGTRPLQPAREPRS